MRVVVCLALVGCAHTPLPDGTLARLDGRIWWDDPVTGAGCARWAFEDEAWGVSLERTWTEQGEGWTREVRVFYNFAAEGEGAYVYAPGWDYTWVEAPGDHATSMPSQQGAMGYVTGFCLVERDARRLVWTESSCDALTDATPRLIGYRRAADCPAAP